MNTARDFSVRGEFETACFLALAAAVLTGSVAQAADLTLLNASYDATRELYKDLNTALARSTSPIMSR